MVLLWRVWILWRDEEVLKKHTDYPITNGVWKYIDHSLWHYLSTFSNGSNNIKYSLPIFAGIPHGFYVRIRFDNLTLPYLAFSKDPWDREFIVYPPGINCKNMNNLVYNYSCFENSDMGIKITVLSTSVNHDTVYCVDVCRYR